MKTYFSRSYRRRCVVPRHRLFDAYNLVYIMRKELTPEKINEVLESLGLIFQFVDLTVSDMTKAADLEWEDYEDACKRQIAGV